ncbi:MAG: hypothetical protein IJ587_10355, partial [Synergistaceae bacterium]|nr:hypothetical protein [Synergistaceae bacterium]
WTIFAGLRFNFNDAVGIKGAFYHQKISGEEVRNDAAGVLGWRDYGYGPLNLRQYLANDTVDSANHWRAIIDVKQELLKFTSLWLEYGQYQEGFFVPQGMSTIFPTESVVLKPFVGGGSQVMTDLKYWRVVLGQEWNEQWATNLFYYGYKASDAVINNNLEYQDAKPYEFGVGVQYKLNDATTMGLNYAHVDSDLPKDAANENTKDNIIRFRTSISF